jgi:hypothetical protein
MPTRNVSQPTSILIVALLAGLLASITPVRPARAAEAPGDSTRVVLPPFARTPT